MSADIAEAGGPEQRIGDRMEQHVGIGMAEQPALEGDLHAADDELAPRHEGMDVETLADAHHACLLCCRILSASTRSAGQVTFRLSGSEGTSSGRWPKASTAADSSVTAGLRDSASRNRP